MNEENELVIDNDDLPQTNDNNTHSGNSWMPITVGVIGIFLGGVALYLGIHGNNKREATESSLQISSQTIAALEEDVSQLQSKLQLIVNKQNATEKQMRRVASQAQTALNTVGTEMTTIQKQVSTNTESINQLSTILQDLKMPPPPVAQTPTTEAIQPEEKAEESSENPKIHVIASGDTLAVLARSYKISLNELLEANPNVDPKRLQIGQKINIP